MTKERMVQQIWMNYFNRYLFERGVITEAMYRKAQSLILARESKHQ